MRQFPFDTLKIDKSFVHDIVQDTSAKNLVCSIISMAHGLGMEVVAEGVETKDQADTLKSLSCDLAQGFYFSKSLRDEELDCLL